jgi:aryl-alcohol dehydrogenase-like predicted oxidoreductase
MSLDSYRTLGPTGLRVSPLCLGAMTFGSEVLGTDEGTSRELIARYTAAGGNFIDTANGYSQGRSEEVIGAYLAGHKGLRDRLVIATKFAANLFPGDPNGGGTGRKAILHQVEGSLRRLGTDYIDLYWQHNFDQHTPVEETMSTLDDLVRAGKIRYIGLSDTPAWAVAHAATIAGFRGWTGVAAIQVEYSLLERTVEGELFGAARAFGLGVTPWSPLANGLLSGKYTRDDQAPAGSNRAHHVASRLTERTFSVVDALQRIADGLGASIAAVALAWVRQQQPVTSTIIGVRTAAQLDANLASLDVTIPDEKLAELDALTTPQLNFPADFLKQVAVDYQQRGATVNGVASRAR